MFGKLNKVLMGAVLLGGIMSGNCSETAPLSPYQQTAKTMAASLVDSFEFGKPTRAFTTTLRSKIALITGLQHLCKTEEQSAEQKFYNALNQIFSKDTLEITDSALNLILQSALAGYKDADDIVKTVSGGRSILKIKNQDYTVLKEGIKMRLQGFIEESSSDDEPQTVGKIMKEAEVSSTLDSTICSTCESVKSVVKSSDIAFKSETLDTQEKKRLAISLLRQLRTQAPSSMKDRLTGLIKSVGITDYPETENEFNKSLSALGNCTSMSQYNKYFTPDHLRDYTILLNFLATIAEILGHKPTMCVSINNVVGHLWSCIEEVTSREGYDSTLLTNFEKLANKYMEDE